MNNSLNLIFGPRLPSEFEHVGLSFIAAPVLTPDKAIANLSAERYAPENYSHIDTELEIFNAGFREGLLKVDISYPPLSFNSRFSNPLVFNNISGNVLLTGKTWGFKVLDSPIFVNGLNITPANTWYPTIQPGVVWRLHTISANEPASSWLIRSGLTTDDTIIAIYSTPEIAYSTTASGIAPQFPPSPSFYKRMKEVASPIGPNKFTVLGDIYYIEDIYVNGEKQYSGSLNWTVGDAPSYIKQVNRTSRIIEITGFIKADDHIEVIYRTYNQSYEYSGFRDINSVWYPFDGNPEYGHYIGDDNTNSIRNSSDCLLDQVTIYAIPTAYIKYTFTPSEVSTGVDVGSLFLEVVRGVDYGETHFIRHIVTGERGENIQIRSGATSVSTWGEATFGRNYYDESGIYDGDVFSDLIPSMIPLGRFVLAAPASINSIAVADIRQRGGGVPVDFPMIAVETQASGLDTLRGYYDLGIWEGQAIKEGGVVEVRIDSSLLKTDENDTDPNKFLASEIYEIVKSQMLPGIDFSIIFTDV